jgi:mono/diheme cytochrome c family protein
MMRALLVAAALALAGSAVAAPVNYQLPEEIAAFAPGPNLDVAQANCGACHSADYVSTQPRGLPDPAAFWTAEVTKMRKVYKADIPDADVPAIVAYLVASYGK